VDPRPEGLREGQESSCAPCIAAEPDLADPYQSWGRSHSNEGNLETAIEELTKATQLDPGIRRRLAALGNTSSRSASRVTRKDAYSSCIEADATTF
jgi:Flp pilus assembly protein TadD